jgi:hypothetical protein
MSINKLLEEEKRIAIKRVCQRMIAGETSFIEGARFVLSCATDARIKDSDPDLAVFAGIASETDEVPSKRLLEVWNHAAAEKRQLTGRNWRVGLGAMERPPVTASFYGFECQTALVHRKSA